MADHAMAQLSRRERQIMDVLYRRGQATASEVLEGLPDPPGYSAVRAMLRLLEEKGVIAHDEDGPRYVYRPVVARDKALRSELKRVLRTFFDNSAEQAVAALLDLEGKELSSEELDRLAQLIDDARREGR
ncbi:MAG TPA: BlaI/MecI/CopY family transcriptional regulator [Gemmatimonadaceae bacterium]|nr:BlaI/MecI/CopY family transcriptional regulator [Gemmatimonadaceae bacterium]